MRVNGELGGGRGGGARDLKGKTLKINKKFCLCNIFLAKNNNFLNSPLMVCKKNVIPLF